MCFKVPPGNFTQNSSLWEPLGPQQRKKERSNQTSLHFICVKHYSYKPYIIILYFYTIASATDVCFKVPPGNFTQNSSLWEPLDPQQWKLTTESGTQQGYVLLAAQTRTGWYRCSAANEHGSDHHDIKYIVSGENFFVRVNDDGDFRGVDDVNIGRGGDDDDDLMVMILMPHDDNDNRGVYREALAPASISMVVIICDQVGNFFLC